MKVSEIKNQLLGMSLEFLSVKDAKIENAGDLPYFVNSFYKYIELHNKVPTQNQFYKLYCKDHAEDLSGFNNRLSEALKARLYRAYPSYVRDFMFSHLLYEVADFDEIIYDPILDVEEGVDILIKENGIKYAVNLYVDTYRSNQYRKRKYNRHPDKDKEYVDIDLPLSMKSAIKIGDFYVYSFKHIIKIMNFILKYQKKGD